LDLFSHRHMENIDYVDSAWLFQQLIGNLQQKNVGCHLLSSRSRCLSA
jgi:hypothetical protein